MAFQIARGRKSGKPFLMVKCLRDGRHFRGFVGDQVYVRKLLELLERGNDSETVMKS
jgi:rRNA processing protein Gar1